MLVILECHHIWRSIITYGINYLFLKFYLQEIDNFDILSNFANLYKITNLSEVSAIPSYTEMEIEFAPRTTFEKYKNNIYIYI